MALLLRCKKMIYTKVLKNVYVYIHVYVYYINEQEEEERVEILVY